VDLTAEIKISENVLSLFGALYAHITDVYGRMRSDSTPSLVRVDPRGRSCDYWAYGSDSPLPMSGVVR